MYRKVRAGLRCGRLWYSKDTMERAEKARTLHAGMLDAGTADDPGGPPVRPGRWTIGTDIESISVNFVNSGVTLVFDITPMKKTIEHLIDTSSSGTGRSGLLSVCG